jgi:hypothetical protein
MALSRKQLQDRQQRERQREFARKIAAFDPHTPVRLLSSLTPDSIEPFMGDLRPTALTNGPMNAADSSRDSIAMTPTPAKQRRRECKQSGFRVAFSVNYDVR